MCGMRVGTDSELVAASLRWQRPEQESWAEAPAAPFNAQRDESLANAHMADQCDGLRPLGRWLKSASPLTT